MNATKIILHLDERDNALIKSAYWRTVVLPQRKATEAELRARLARRTS